MGRKKRRCFWHRRSLGRKRPRKQGAEARLPEQLCASRRRPASGFAAMQHLLVTPRAPVADQPQSACRSAWRQRQAVGTSGGTAADAAPGQAGKPVRPLGGDRSGTQARVPGDFDLTACARAAKETAASRAPPELREENHPGQTVRQSAPVWRTVCLSLRYDRQDNALHRSIFFSSPL